MSHSPGRPAGTDDGDGPTAPPRDPPEVDDPPRVEDGAASPAPVDVRGAIYLPTRAYNWFQMWDGYDPDVIERDLGYAASVRLNAIRTSLNYEYWASDAEATEEAFDHLLETAAANDIRLLIGLFEGVGRKPRPRMREVTDPWHAVPLQSPSNRVVRHERRWRGPRRFVDWFMDRYRDDERLLAIEVMNEPGWRPSKRRFARAMYRRLEDRRGEVPLTVGSTSLANNAYYAGWGVDIFQFHYNNPRNRVVLADVVRQAAELAAVDSRPVWLTEWQWIADLAWDGPIEGAHGQPNYATIAPVLRAAGIGNFFWSLMVKPAYRRHMRRKGLINGLFHEDGTVWSLDDARAIKAMSGDPSFEGDERPAWPEWLAAVKRRALESGGYRSSED